MNRHTAHLYNILECSPAVEKKDESYCPYVECEVPKDLILHIDHLMHPLVIGFERFEENIWKI